MVSSEEELPNRIITDFAVTLGRFPTKGRSARHVTTTLYAAEKVTATKGKTLCDFFFEIDLVLLQKRRMRKR